MFAFLAQSGDRWIRTSGGRCMVLAVIKLQAKVKVCGGEGGADIEIAKRIRQGDPEQ